MPKNLLLIPTLRIKAYADMQKMKWPDTVVSYDEIADRIQQNQQSMLGPYTLTAKEIRKFGFEIRDDGSHAVRCNDCCLRARGHCRGMYEADMDEYISYECGPWQGPAGAMESLANYAAIKMAHA